MGVFDSLGGVLGAVTSVFGVGTALIGAQVAGPVLASREQRKATERATRIQQQANDTERAVAQFEQNRRRRAISAQARIARAENTAAPLAQGGQANLSSSAFQGAQASIGTSSAANLSSINRSFNLSNRTFDLRQQSQNILDAGQLKANTFNAYAQSSQAATNAAFRVFAGV